MVDSLASGLVRFGQVRWRGGGAGARRQKRVQKLMNNDTATFRMLRTEEHMYEYANEGILRKYLPINAPNVTYNS